MGLSRLGRAGLKVSRIGLGAMGFGDQSWRSWVLDLEQSRRYSLHSPAVVQQQQRIHPPVHRARRLATLHPKQMHSVLSYENCSAHASQRIPS